MTGYIRPNIAPPKAESVFRAAEAFFPKRVTWPAPFAETLDRFEEASARLARAHRLVAAGRILESEWEVAAKAHNAAEAEAHGPENWTPYPEPRPDPIWLMSVAKEYEGARQRAGASLTKAATDPKVWGVIEAAWLRASTDPSEALSVAEHRVALALQTEARNAIAAAARAVVMASGCSDLERRRWDAALKDEGRLLSLGAIRDRLSGRATREADEAKTAAAKAAKKTADSEYATEAAKARLAGAKGK